MVQYGLAKAVARVRFPIGAFMAKEAKLEARVSVEARISELESSCIGEYDPRSRYKEQTLLSNTGRVVRGGLAKHGFNNSRTFWVEFHPDGFEDVLQFSAPIPWNEVGNYQELVDILQRWGEDRTEAVVFFTLYRNGNRVMQMLRAGQEYIVRPKPKRPGEKVGLRHITRY